MRDSLVTIDESERLKLEFIMKDIPNGGSRVVRVDIDPLSFGRSLLSAKVWYF